MSGGAILLDCGKCSAVIDVLAVIPRRSCISIPYGISIYVTCSPVLRVGEGTWQQLLRMALHSPHMMNGWSRGEGGVAVDEGSVALWAACTLKAIWISHAHADHHLGLVSGGGYECVREGGREGGSVCIDGCGVR